MARKGLSFLLTTIEKIQIPKNEDRQSRVNFSIRLQPILIIFHFRGTFNLIKCLVLMEEGEVSRNVNYPNK